MTLPELVSRLAWPFAVDDATSMSARDLAAVIDAVNAGIAEFYRVAPSRYKIKKVAHLLPAPATITLAATVGSSTVTGYSCASANYGKTVIVGDDPRKNQFVSATGLLAPYQGANAATSAILYGDAVGFGYQTFSMTTHPVLDDKHELVFVSPTDDRLWRTSAAGTPRYYWTERAAPTEGGSIYHYLKVFPYPAAAGVIKFDAMVSPARFAFADAMDPTKYIPVRDDIIEEVLIPLCMGYLANHARKELWPDDMSRKIAREEQEIARVKASHLPAYEYSPSHSIGTPPGF
jgi:hypothetical protein